MNTAEIVRQAREELDKENFRQAAETKKQELRVKRSLWDRLFPFTITITIKRKT